MGDFEDFYRRSEERARQAGPEAAAEFDNLKRRFTFASQLVKRRLELGLTQKQLAERSGVHQSDISRTEHGRSNLTFDTMSDLLRALGVEVCVQEHCDADMSRHHAALAHA